MVSNKDRKWLNVSIKSSASMMLDVISKAKKQTKGRILEEMIEKYAQEYPKILEVLSFMELANESMSDCLLEHDVEHDDVENDESEKALPFGLKKIVGN